MKFYIEGHQYYCGLIYMQAKPEKVDNSIYI